MSKNFYKQLCHPRFVGPSAKCRSKQTLHSRDHALDLPALPEAPTRKMLQHLFAVLAFDHGPRVSAVVNRNCRQRNPQRFTAQLVELFCVAGAITRKKSKTDAAGRLGNGFRKILGIVTGLGADCHAADDVRSMLTSQNQFCPGPITFTAATLAKEVSADMAGFESRCVNRAVCSRFNHAESASTFGDDVEEFVNVLFFKNRACAFWSVVKCGTSFSPNTLHRSEESLSICAMPR